MRKYKECGKCIFYYVHSYIHKIEDYDYECFFDNKDTFEVNHKCCLFFDKSSEKLKIYVDDVRELPKEFNIEASADQCIMIVRYFSEYIDILSLDHDLGENNIDGYEIIKEIEQIIYTFEIKKPFNIICHSMNPVGKKNIESVIEKINKYWKDNSN